MIDRRCPTSQDSKSSKRESSPTNERVVRRFAYHLGIASDKRASDILSERRERDQLKEGGARADLAGRTWRHLKRLISHYSQPPPSPAEEDPGISPSSDKQWNVVMMRV